MHSQWSKVDAYLGGQVGAVDPELQALLDANAAAGLPSIDVSPVQGKLLHLIALMTAARQVLEIGTLGGYSTVWLARAVPVGGRVITLEANPAHAAVARSNLNRAGVGERVDIRVGPALDTLPQLSALAPFDLVFIDADKINTAAYLDWALRLTRPGAVIIADNVVRDGAVADPHSDDPSVLGMQAMFDRLAVEPRVVSTAIQTVGAKGWDGMVIAVVR